MAMDGVEMPENFERSLPTTGSLYNVSDKSYRRCLFCSFCCCWEYAVWHPRTKNLLTSESYRIAVARITTHNERQGLLLTLRGDAICISFLLDMSRCNKFNQENNFLEGSVLTRLNYFIEQLLNTDDKNQMILDMASHGSLSVAVSTSPKNGNREAETVRSSSPRGQCLCSPTTHQGSFRCRLHRSTSSAWMKRSKSLPANNSVASLSPKGSLGST